MLYDQWQLEMAQLSAYLASVTPPCLPFGAIWCGIREAGMPIFNVLELTSVDKLLCLFAAYLDFVTPACPVRLVWYLSWGERMLIVNALGPTVVDKLLRLFAVYLNFVTQCDWCGI